MIVGRRGDICKHGAGYSVAVMLNTRRQLFHALAKLCEFLELRQVGDTEAVLHMPALPTAEQAVTLREILKVRKIREVSDEKRARLAEMSRRFSPMRPPVRPAV